MKQRKAYISDTIGFLNQVDRINKKEKTENIEMADDVKKYAAWYRKQHPRATDRQVLRAVDKKFWGK